MKDPDAKENRELQLIAKLQEELKIEEIVNRIRAKAMTMTHSEDLAEVSLLMFEEFDRLDVEHLGLGIHIINDDLNTYSQYGAMDDMVNEKKALRTTHGLKISDLSAARTMFEKLQAGEKDPTLLVEGEALHEWFDEVESKVDSTRGKALKNSGAERVYFHFATFHGYSHIASSSLQPSSERTTKIFRKMADAFGLCYRRYLDLKKAEEQVREAEIQVALERVRSRSMAMNHSDELPEVSKILFDELKNLGLELYQSYIAIVNEDNDTATLSVTNFGGEYYSASFILPLDHPATENQVRLWREGEALIEHSYVGHQDVKRWFDAMLALSGDELFIFDEYPEAIYNCEASNLYGSLGMSAKSPYDEPSKKLLIRFAKVFEQTYTRFLDLKKAEEQAREALIEAALERVRAASMAMHHSDQLMDVANVLFKEISQLDVNVTFAWVSHIHVDKGFSELWMSGLYDRELLETKLLFVANDANPTISKILQAWKEGEKFYHYPFKGKEVEEWLKSLIETTSDESFRAFFKEEFLDQVIAFTKYGTLGMSHFGAIPEKVYDLLHRFAMVFEQAYTRFLDLKKAEEQSREAQIEASLERVRSSSMALHKSDELGIVVKTMFDELNKIGITDELSRTYINISDDQTGHTEMWVTGIGGDYVVSSFEFNVNEHRKWQELFDQFILIPPTDRIQKRYTIKYEGEDWDNLVAFAINRGLITEEASQGLKEAGHLEWYDCCAFFAYGNITIAGVTPISETNHTILQRFASVFEQSYTRFLDIQRAEEQARESQIEAALERVRAASMAMHQSEQLMDVANVLFTQLAQLDIDIVIAWISHINMDQGINKVWLTGYFDSVKETTSFVVPIETIPHVIEAWQSGQPFLNYQFEGKDVEAHIDNLVRASSFEEMNEYRNADFSDNLSVFTKYGTVGAGHVKKLSSDVFEILPRFAKVFEQAYTRFLDLQKAENQAREAQIEAALERVRTRSMGMYRSEELAEVAVVVFDELRNLDVPVMRSGFDIFNDRANQMVSWMSTSDGQLIKECACIPFDAHPGIQEALNSWKSEKVFKRKYAQSDLKKIAKIFYEYSLDIMKEYFQGDSQVPDQAYIYNFWFSHGGLSISSLHELSEQQEQLCLRFTKVFEQTYTRFTDLKKTEAQAREAQIEAALERVRTRTMAMHQSSELSLVASAMFEEFQALGLTNEFTRIIIDIIDEDTAESTIWLTGMGGNKITKEFTHSNFDNELWTDEFNRFLKTESSKRKEEIYTIVYENESYDELIEWAIGQNITNKKELNALKKAGIRKWVEHNSWFAQGRLVIGSDRHLTQGGLDIIQRFAAVFEQTYTRFLDLQKAEYQAREAQIEAALERVRAASMAMHESSELVKVATVVYQQLLSLGFEQVVSCGFLLPLKEEGIQKCWFSETDTDLFEVFDLPYSGDWVLDERLEYWHNNEAYLEQILSPRKLKKHMDFLFPENTRDDDLQSAVEAMPPLTVFNMAFFKHGYLNLISNEKLSEEQRDILIRFTSVFEQAYTRFLDLERAEKQAREAQIEAALERLRARVMAMHKSDELGEVIGVLYDQIDSLGVNYINAFVTKWDLDTMTSELMFTGVDGYRHDKATVVDVSTPEFAFAVDSWKNRHKVPYTRAFYPAESMEALLEIFIGDIEFPPESKPKSEHYPNGMHVCAAYYDHGEFGITMPEPADDEVLDIVIRFAKVFNQCYTRFLDLQKAEKQAREAQIEAALERVRAASMAMHKSEEMASVARTVFEQLKDLGIEVYRSWVDIFYEEEGYVLTYTTDFKGKFQPKPATFPLDFDESMDYFLADFKSPSRFIELQARGADVKDWFKKLYDTSRDPVFKMTHVPKELHQIWAKHKYGTVATTKIEPFTDDEKEILARFAKVFEQAYTRFLDIERAEAQTREAQIEAALEKVRARSMAMHNSEELAECAEILFDQLRELDVNVQTAWFSVFIENQKLIRTYFTDKAFEPGYTDELLSEYSNGKAFLKAWKNRDPIFLTQLKGKKLKDYMAVLAKNPLMLKSNVYKEWSKNVHKCWSVVQSPFSKGMVGYGTFEEPKDSDYELLPRFTKVFNQTYTRFLDLQKAEAQAREAQIEAALEKVRAASLAMHQSEDLHQVIQVVYEQLEVLGISMNSAMLLEDIHDPRANHFWAAANGQVYPDLYHVPVKDIAFFSRFRKAVKDGEKFYTQRLSKRGKDAFFRHYFDKSNHTDVPEDRKDFIFAQPGLHRLVAIQEHTAISIMRYNLEPFSSEEEALLPRIAKVFEQAYTRFHDLQRAEAQAREAQIEASLERIRSRALAMHRTDELDEVVGVIFEELKQIGFAPQLCAIGIYDADTKGADWWSYIAGHDLPGAYYFPYLKGRWFKEVYQAWVQQKSHHYIEMMGREWKEMQDLIYKETEWKNLPEDIKSTMYDLGKDGLTASYISMKKGMLEIVTPEPIDEEQVKLLQRFTKVINMTYNRVNDLERAERQAREAQIETALERVRAAGMAMHHSDELKNVCLTLNEQLETLGILPEFYLVDIGISDEEKRQVVSYQSQVLKQQSESVDWIPDKDWKMVVDVDELVEFVELFEAWAKIPISERKHHSKVIKYRWNEMVDWTIKNRERTQEEQEAFKDLVSSQSISWYTNSAFFAYGTLNVHGNRTLADDEFSILQRFAATFEQLYTRFLDLQKAEAQTREAQIEAALERVRAAGMAMHHSDELKSVCSVLNDQLMALDILPEINLVEISIINEEKRTSTVYQIFDIESNPYWQSTINFDDLEEFKETFDSWRMIPSSERKFHTKYIKYRLEEIVKWGLENRARTPEELKAIEGLIEALNHTGYHSNMAFFAQGGLNVGGDRKLTDDEYSILQRFAATFEQSYTRFLDLQKAEAQAREAQIEASLERIRASSMAMHHSSELFSVVEVVFTQLKELEIDVMTSWITHYFLEDNVGETWVTGFFESATPTPKKVRIPLDGNPQIIQIIKDWKAGKKYTSYRFEANEQTEWANSLIAMTGLEDFEVFKSLQFTDNIDVFHNYGSIGMASEAPISSDNTDILYRIAQVFDQAYTRFLDLQKAEAQAREAQIELSLERIRAMAMAMQESTDLLDIVVKMRSEFISLGHEAHYFWHMKWSPKIYEKAMTSGDGSRIGMIMELPRHIHGDIPLLDKWEKGKEPTVIYAMDPDEAIAYVDKMVTLGDFKKIDDNAPTEDDLRGIGGLTFVMARTKHGEIGYSLPGAVPNPPQDDLNTLKRFADTFDLAYRRFEDLKQAEEQAREALIEAAMEKVRARAMAMHKTEELVEVAQVLRTEMGKLGVEELETASIYVHDKDTKTTQCWFTIQDKDDPSTLINDHIHFQLKETWVGREMLKFYRSKKQTTSIVMEGENRKEWIEYCVNNAEHFTVEGFYGEEIPERTYHLYKFDYGYMGVASPGDISQESWDLLRRATKVFSLAYTRFLDIQKAEEQARKAQIDAAMEKVRARAMAMHSSDELKEVAQLLRSELGELGVEELETSSIFILPQGDQHAECWFAVQNKDKSDELINGYASMDLTRTWATKELLKFFKSKKRMTTVVLSGDHLKEYVEYCDETSDVFSVKEFYGDEIPDLTYYYYFYKFKHGFIGAASLGEISKESWELLRRATQVFSLAYTRFNDLKLAEAQSREAQIETALERVRAKAMAMHDSKNLLDAISEFFVQLKILGVVPVRCGVAQMFADPPSWTAAATNSTLQGKSVQLSGIVDNLCHPVLQGIYDHWVKQESYFPILKDKDIRDYYKVLRPQIAIPKFPKGQAHHGHYFYFKEGCVFAWTPQPMSAEEQSIFRRFSGVLSLTYRRYLDLKESEVQAREAQIEAALERIRAASMAMHKSDELSNVALILFRQLVELEVPTKGSVIHIESDGLVTSYLAMDDAEDGAPLISRVESKLSEIPNTFAHRKIMRLLNSGEKDISVELKGKHYEEFLDYMRDNVNAKRAANIRRLNLKRYYLHNYAFQGLSNFMASSTRPLTREERDLLRRMTDVFSMSYRRFLDLKKAESQAREAEIEAALERIRAASMAMHKSEELPNVALVLFRQLVELKVPTLGSALNIETDGFITSYLALDNAKDGTTLITRKEFKLSEAPDTYYNRKIIRSIKSGEKDISIELKGKRYGEYLEYIRDNISTKRAANIRKLNLKRYYLHNFVFHGLSNFLASSTRPLTQDEKDLLRRMADVFGMSYQRFLDLKKAESQAREAEIEAALERIRAASMAMHKSDELSNVTLVLFRQLVELEVPTLGSAVNIEEDDGMITSYQALNSAKDGTTLISHEIIDLSDSRLPFGHRKVIRLIRSGLKDISIELKGKQYEEFLDYVRDNISTKRAANLRKLNLTKYYFNNFVFHGMSNFMTSSTRPLTQEERDLLRRMTDVFGMSYQRFLDLKKAESQAREAEIEAALERIRAASMAMHKSDELSNVAQVLFSQLTNLEIPALGGGVWIQQEDGSLKSYSAVNNFKDDFPLVSEVTIPNSIDTFHSRKMKREYEAGKKDVCIKLKGAHFEEFIDSFARHVDRQRAVNLKKLNLKEFHINSFFFHGQSQVVASSTRPLSEDEKGVLRRITDVFSRSYQRFLDLKKAESQAREAEIEAALERIRAASMAMHKSDELSNVALVFFTQLMELKVPTLGSGIWVYQDDGNIKYYSALDNLKDDAPQIHKVTIPGTIDTWHYRKVKRLHKSGMRDISLALKGSHFDEFLGVFGKYIDLERAANLRKLKLKEFHMHSLFFHGQSMVLASSTRPLTQEERDLLRRMTDVFGMSYQRFLDLKKAESQAREAEIEAALERVRSRTMAMHHSDELAEVASVVFEQMKSLGIDAPGCSFVILNHDNMDADLYFSVKGKVIPQKFRWSLALDSTVKKVYQAWKDGERFYVDDMKGRRLASHYKKNEAHWKATGQNLMIDMAAFSEEHEVAPMMKRMVVHLAFFSHGYINFTNFEPLEGRDIMIRFAKVFEQTYTRFLDLQKAESQAREAQIEAALERVRSASMAMHKSEELIQVANTIFEQFAELQLEAIHSWVTIAKEGAEQVQIYSTEFGGHVHGSEVFYLDVTHPLFKSIYDIWLANKQKKSVPVNTYNFEGREVREFMKAANSAFDRPFYDLKRVPNSLHHSEGHHLYGNVGFATMEALNDEGKDILSRFARVFEQTYTRFLDLQKAESQAREAQIEASLERVRAASMAMHKTEELFNVTKVIFDQLRELGLDFIQSWISIFDLENKVTHAWWSQLEGVTDQAFYTRMEPDKWSVTRQVIDQWKSAPDFIYQSYEGDGVIQFMKTASELAEKDHWIKYQELHKHAKLFITDANHKYGNIGMATDKPHSEEDQAIQKRFARVFEQAYTRYLDIERAEAQAREAQIEAALERVRAASMAMHQSDDLMEVALVFANQLSELGIKDHGVSIQFITDEERNLFIRYAADPQPGKSERILHRWPEIPIEAHAGGREFLKRYEQGEVQFSVETKGSMYSEIQEYLAAQKGDKKEGKLVNPGFDTLYLNFTLIEGKTNIAYSSFQPPSQKDLAIFRRFADVFKSSYTRFKDLKKAEAQAREARIEAALERVRARTTSMHESHELGEVVGVVFDELKQLDFESDTCVIGIINKETLHAQIWQVTGEESGMPSKYEIPKLEHPHIQKGYDAYLEGASYLQRELSGKDKRSYDKLIFEHTALKDLPEVVKQGIQKIKKIYITDAYMSHGMIEVLGDEKLGQEKIDILKRFAAVIDLAYTRFLDIQKSEEYTIQLAKSLEELKSTQSQLIHAEKMASLGSLTAGIAHEIQNPLNFVNNFSEVNVELIDEILEELEADNKEEIKEILADLRMNTEKVAGHGKRADGIVKSMLQHSRAGGGEKIESDLNVMCDEYMRLAYHGMRAKDKSFNASTDLVLDPDLPKVHIVRQDVGRVLLNLLTNAFQAVREKAANSENGMKPKVSIQTVFRQLADTGGGLSPAGGGAGGGTQLAGRDSNGTTPTIKIIVKDNGPGIDQELVEKIFQPFFTTKPTGSGTGLGLSISYDIIKAHGGELTVQSEVGKGTEFVVELPVGG